MAVLEYVVIAQSVVLVALAVALLSFSRRTLPTILLSTWLIAWGFLGGWISIATLSDRFELGGGTGSVINLAMWYVSLTAGLAFAIAYPNLRPTRWRAIALGVLGFWLVGILTAIAVLFWTGNSLVPLWRIHALFSASAAVFAVLLLGHRWLHGRTEAYRMQVVWALLAFVFWTFNDGLLYNFYPAVEVGLPQLLAIYRQAGWDALPWILESLSVVASLGLAAVAIMRVLQGRAGTSDRVVALFTPFLLAFTATQIFWGYMMHIVFDYVPAALVIYGVARFNVVDLDIKLKWSLSRGTVAAAFIAVFFVASELAAVFFEDLIGSTGIGILAAGAVVLFIAPLQGAAERLAQRAMPHVEDNEAYRNYRRIQIYRVALEGALQDGVLNAKEAGSLANLRLHLGLSDTDHEALEAEVRAGTGPPVGPGSSLVPP